MTAEAPAKTIPHGTLSLVSRIRLKGGRTGGTAAFSSDGSKVLAPRLNGWARMWWTLSGDLIRSFEIPEKASSSSFSACGRYHSTVLRYSLTLRAFGPRTKKFKLRSDVLTEGAPRKLKPIWRAGLDWKGAFRDRPSARRQGSDWLSRHLQGGILSLAAPSGPEKRYSAGGRSSRREYSVPEVREAVRLTRPDLLVPLAGSRSVICRGDTLSCFDQDSGKTLWHVCLSADVMVLRAGDQGLVCLLRDFALVLIDPESGLLSTVVASDFGAQVRAADISPDGSIAAWACADGKLRLCRGSRFEDQASLQIQIADADRLQFVGRQHVLLSNGLSVEVIDIASGGQAFFGEGEYLGTSVEGALFSVKPQDGCAVIVNAFSGEVSQTDITACVACLFSPDGRVAWFLSAEKRKLILRRIITSTGLCESRTQLAASGNETAVYELSHIQGAPWPAVSVRMHACFPTASDQAFFPTGGRVIVLNTAAIDSPYALPDGTLAVLLDDKTIRIWDVDTGTERAVLRGHGDWIRGLLLLPDGGLASWSDDKTIRIWDVGTCAERAVLRGHEKAISGILLLPDGKLASWSDDGTIRIWVVGTGTERAVLRGHEGSISGLLLLPDGGMASWSDDRTIRIWDGGTGAERAVLRGHEDRIRGILHCPDGRLASWSWDNTIRIWEVDTGTERAVLREHERWISGILLLPDGGLASSSHDGTIRIWDGGTGAERAVLRGHESRISGIRLLPDGNLASWSEYDKTIRIWDVGTGAEQAVLRGHKHSISGIRVLPDGNLASWSEHEKNIRIWDVGTGAERAVLRGHESGISGALLLPDGRLAAWSEGSSIIRIWTSATHDPAPINAETRWRWQEANSVVVSPGGNRAVSSCYSNGDWSYQLHDLAQGIWSGLPAETGFLQHGWPMNESAPFAIDPMGRVQIIRNGKALMTDESGLARRRICGVKDVDPKQGALIGADDHTFLVAYGGSITQLSESCSEFSIDQGFSRTGRYIWKLHAGGAIDLLEARTQQAVTLLNVGENFAMSQLAFSQDDAFLAVLSSGGEILVFDLSDGGIIGRAYRERGSADAMFVSRDGSWVHLLQDDEVEAWHLGDANDDATTAGKSVLRQNGIPASGNADLAVILGLDFDLALRDLEAGRAYRSFEIPKKSGGKRRIEAPRGPLHALQKELSVRLQSVHEPEPGSHGFVEGRSIVSNAGCHLGRRWVLNVDLKDFFPSVTEARVRGLFRAPPFDLGDEAAATLARLCCRNGGLPQGAPTSPVLANFAARQLDLELKAIASKYDLAVTRYADDITLSSDAERFPGEVALRLGGGETEILTIAGPVLEDAITRSGFAINTAKTRLQYRSERQVVTGLVVNERLSPMRGHIKLVRALIHAWESKGLAAAAEEYFTRHPARLSRGRAAHKIEDFRSTVYGHMSFLHMVRGKTDRQFIAFCRRLSRIDGKKPPVFVREALQQEDGLVGITQ